MDRDNSEINYEDAIKNLETEIYFLKKELHIKRMQVALLKEKKAGKLSKKKDNKKKAGSS